MKSLRVLILEDNPSDAELMIHELRQMGCEPQWQCVETEADYLRQLESAFDVILSDYSMPQFNALRALHLLQERGLDIPFIVVTGSISEEVAVECMKQGAADYLLKDRLIRLGPAVLKALEEKRIREEKRRAEEALRKSEDRYRDLVEHDQDFIFICTHDLQGRILSVNRGAALRLGYGQNDLLKMHLRDILTPQVKDRFDEYLSTIQRDGVAKGLMVVQTITGEIRIWQYNNTLRTEGLEAPIVRAMAYDITERKQAEEALQRSEVEAKRLARESSMLAKIGRIITSTLNIDEVYELFAEEVQKVIPFDHVTINMINSDNRTSTIAYVHGVEIADRPRGKLIPLSGTVTEETARTRTALLIQGKDMNELGTRFPGMPLMAWTQFGSNISVPLISKDRGIAVLHFGSLNPNAYTEMDLRLAERVGNQIAGAIANAQLYRQRKQAEEALRESESRYRTLAESAQDAIFILDREGRFQYLNRFGRDQLAPSSEGILGKTLRQVFPAEVAEEQMLALQTVFESHKTFSHEIKITFPHGDEWSDVRLIPIVTQNGEVQSVMGIARDVTERKRAEEALRESENRYRNLIMHSPDAIMINLRDRVILVNNECLSLFGARTAEDLIGKSPYDLFHPDFHEQIRKRIHRLRDLGEATPLLEEKIVRLDGRNVDVEVHAAPFPSGDTNAIHVILHDITDRKRAEERLWQANQKLQLSHAATLNLMEDLKTENEARKKSEAALRGSERKYQELFDEAPVGYHEFDIEGRITRVNRTELEMLGYTLEERIGEFVWSSITEEDKSRQTVLDKLAGVIPPSRSLERTYRRKDGTTFPVLIQDQLLRDKDGRIAGIRSTIQDITERKRAEQEAASLQNQLRQSQKVEAIGQLAGGIAHDFNNLLTVIQGYAQISLLDLQEKDPLKANIEEIREAAKKAADLTRQLLAFSRKQILEMRVLDLNQVLQGLDKMLRRVIGEDIELTMFLPESIWKVKADPGQMEQVIINLAVNARDAMPNGGKLTIETANVELDEEYAYKHIAVKPGRHVMLSMSDTGVGMTPEVRERVFEPFFTTKERGKGTGLGLSMVYGIVKQSGGNIWVYSELGQGTTVKIYLPEVDEPVEELKEEVVGEVLQGDETILIVEDEEVVRKLAVRVLKTQGYKVLEAPDGGKAFMLCEEYKEPIDLILTDVVMPGMSGRKLVDRLKAIHPEIKVLYMSGYTDNAILHHGILEPGINFIQKPFTVESLPRKVREVLDK